jgi:hypothetical protein
MQKITVLLAVLFFILPAYSQRVFTEVSDSIGLGYIYPGNDFQLAGGGLMVIDVNNDGWEDLYQSGGVFDSKLWVNNQGVFYDATDDFGLDALYGYFIQGAVSADYDNDGFEDFFVANFGKGFGQGDKHAPVLLHNVKGERFEPIFLDSILPAENYASACWGDINNDGFVDLYVANYVKTMSGLHDQKGKPIGYNPTCYENKLLINIDGKYFEEQAEKFGLNDSGCGLAVSLTDFDNDNDLDLLLLNDFGEWTKEGNKVFRNNYPELSFTNISKAVGFDQEIYGMGIGQGDFNNNGQIDYYITNIGRNYLFTYEDSLFTDQAEKLGVDIPFVYDSIYGTSWSGLFFDLEFDGDQDLYVAKGNVATLVPPAAISDANKLFINEGGKFLDKTTESGLSDVLSHRGAVVFDFDHDGDLDIISSVVKLPWAAFAGKEQKIKAYQNEAEAGNYVGIKLKGMHPFNRSAIGARVIFNQNGVKSIREVDGGSGHASQGTKIIYFGLGNKKSLDEVQINFGDDNWISIKELKHGKIYTIDSEGKVE